MVEDTVTLGSLYDNSELYDDREFVSHYRELSDQSFTVKILPYSNIKYVLTRDGKTSVVDAYKNFATPAQKKLVGEKLRFFDQTRIVIMDGNMVVDGNHHLIAAFKSKKDVKYIDLADIS